jgi:hypothetical protein
VTPLAMRFANELTLPIPLYRRLIASSIHVVSCRSKREHAQNVRANPVQQEM